MFLHCYANSVMISCKSREFDYVTISFSQSFSYSFRFLAKVNSFKVMGSERAGGKDRACLVTSQNPYVGE